MEVSGAALAGVTAFVVLAGLVGVVGLALAAYLDVSGGRGRALLLSGFVGAGVVVGLVGTMISGYTVRIGGWGSHLKDAGDPSSGTVSSGFDFPLGAVIGLVLLTALLTAAAMVLRRPLGVGCAAGGWVAVVGTMMFGTGTAGDMILANTKGSQVWVYGGMVIAFGVGVLGYQWQLTDRLAQAAGERVR